MTRVKVWRSLADDRWYVQVKAPNGKVLAHSQGYKDRRGAERCAELIAGGGTVESAE